MNRTIEEYLKRNSYLMVENGQVTKFREYPKNIGTLLIDTDSISGLISIQTDKGYIVIGKSKQLDKLKEVTNGIIKTTWNIKIVLWTETSYEGTIWVWGENINYEN